MDRQTEGIPLHQGRYKGKGTADYMMPLGDWSQNSMAIIEDLFTLVYCRIPCNRRIERLSREDRGESREEAP